MGHLLISCGSCQDELPSTTFYEPPHDRSAIIASSAAIWSACAASRRSCSRSARPAPGSARHANLRAALPAQERLQPAIIPEAAPEHPGKCRTRR